MSDDEKKVDKFANVEVFDVPETPTVTEEDQSRLSRLLGDLQIGWKISIIRTAPSWCRGHLETIEVYGPDENVDVDYLINTWGGQRILMKVHKENGEWLGGGSISLFSYPPKVHGEIITMAMLQKQMGINQMASTPVRGGGGGGGQVPQFPMQTAPGVPQIDMNKLLEMVQGSKKENLSLILKLIEQNQTKSTPQASQIQPMMEQMMSMFQLFGQMKTMFGADMGPAPGGGGGDESMIPMIGELIKGVMAPKSSPQPSPRASNSIVGPRPIVPVPAPVPGAAPATPKKGPVTNLDDVVNSITSLSPNDAADVIAASFGNMPEAARALATQRFMANVSNDFNDDELDESTIQDDTNYQDEDDQTPNTRQ